LGHCFPSALSKVPGFAYLHDYALIATCVCLLVDDSPGRRSTCSYSVCYRGALFDAILLYGLLSDMSRRAWHQGYDLLQCPLTHDPPAPHQEPRASSGWPVTGRFTRRNQRWIRPSPTRGTWLMSGRRRVSTPKAIFAIGPCSCTPIRRL
jgi:hypothetical protein